MERKIGEIFEYNGEWYQCVKGLGCNECDLSKLSCYHRFTSGSCSPNMREDETQVIFKKLEKVGEPFSCNYHGDARLVMMQEYQLYEANAIYNYGSPPMYISDYKHKRIAIELKNKEDMEEKKLNLKPFDIQKAREGKPVCTRDGHKVRIICFDAKGNKPLIILSEIDGKEVILRYTEKGQSDNFHSPTPREDDLMMLPEKKEGWVNVYKGGLLDTKSYPTKKEAFDKASPKDYVDTIKINWSE